MNIFIFMFFEGNRGVAKRRAFKALPAMTSCLSLCCCHGGARSTEPAPQSGLITLFDRSELRRQPNDFKNKPVIASHCIAPEPGKMKKGLRSYSFPARSVQRGGIKTENPLSLSCGTAQNLNK
jgi:hypothetical protein